MFYRRKLILALLEELYGKLGDIQVQKLIFIISKLQQNSTYDFVPFKYGCYSWSLKADLEAMVKRQMIIEGKNQYHIDKDKRDISFYEQLRPEDKEYVTFCKLKFQNFSSNDLLKYTYTNYPYYAINSEVVNKLDLSKEQIDNIASQQNQTTENRLLTIGYQGISLEEFFNRLIKNNVKLLVDVRKNPMSQKFGFSKSRLLSICKNLNISYLHTPEVGINRDKRQTLDKQKDYDALFEIYKSSILPKNNASQELIINKLNEYKRIALMCFEAKTCECHRTHLAESIVKSSKGKIVLEHI